MQKPDPPGWKQLSALFEKLKNKFAKEANTKEKELEDLFDRYIFAQEIFNKIKKEHNNRKDSSFIFGISAYWGEGKTHLLKLLEEILKANGYLVIWFSPWKFAGDKVSLMRRFISIINGKLPHHSPFIGRIDLSDFQRDKTSFSLDIRGLLLVATILILVFLGFLGFSRASLTEQILRVSPLISIFVVPLFLAALAKILTMEKSIKAISAVDQFDSRLDRILKRLGFLRRKAVVFVDDLDRISPEEAKRVLDALRTFFDKPALTYVVTGDHKTLEDFIGKQLSTGPDSDPSEEGRRFLKKIFNVYWRIPLPTKTQMRRFIEKQIREIELAEEEKETLTAWLIRFFDLNPRNTERFLEMLSYNLKTLERRKRELEKRREEEQESIDQITEVLENKLLLARALMLQEMVYPLFEKIVKTPSLIKQIEEKVDSGQDYTALIQKITLTDSQKEFLSEFLLETPRFFMGGGTKVRLQPFFRLAGEVGLSDERGVSLEAFEKFLTEGEVEKIGSWLNIFPNVSEHAVKAQQIVESEQEEEKKRDLLEVIVSSLEKAPKASSQFLPNLVPIIKETHSSVDSGARMAMFKRIFALFKHLGDEEKNSVVQTLQFTHQDDFNHIDQQLEDGPAKIVANWINAYMEQNFWDAIDKSISAFPNLNTEDIKEALTSKEDSVVDQFMGANDDQREKLFTFLKASGGESKLREHLKKEFDDLSEQEQIRIVNFIIQKYGKRTWGKPRVRKWMETGS